MFRQWIIGTKIRASAPPAQGTPDSAPLVAAGRFGVDAGSRKLAQCQAFAVGTTLGDVMILSVCCVREDHVAALRGDDQRHVIEAWLELRASRQLRWHTTARQRIAPSL
jgi:predicted RecB family endonuclease